MNTRIIKGKWNKNTYKILKSIGRGGIARVFKVQDVNNKKVYALKISDDMNSITKEKERLDIFKNIGVFPKIREIDDYIHFGKSLFFIVIEYIDGQNLKEYRRLSAVDNSKLIDIGIRVGDALDSIHGMGYIYGDLKLENIIYNQATDTIRLVDLGGVVKIGMPVQEYTPCYDRAKWNVGKRVADKGYDMFAHSMMLVTLATGSTNMLKKSSINEVVKELKKRRIDYRIIRNIELGLKQKNIDFDKYMLTFKEIKKNLINKTLVSYSFVDRFINIILSSSVIAFIIVLLLNLHNSA